MWRVDKTRSELNSEESDNVEDTRADYPSVAYFETVKTITAGEKAVILGNTEELPMEYEPLPGTDGSAWHLPSCPRRRDRTPSRIAGAYGRKCG